MATPSEMRKALGPVLKKSDKMMNGRRYPYDLNAYNSEHKPITIKNILWCCKDNAAMDQTKTLILTLNILKYPSHLKSN